MNSSCDSSESVSWSVLGWEACGVIASAPTALLLHSYCTTTPSALLLHYYCTTAAGDRLCPRVVHLPMVLLPRLTADAIADDTWDDGCCSTRLDQEAPQ